MTKKEFLKLYEGKAVWCKTEELANEFLELADGFGFRWATGEKLIHNTGWRCYKEDTCYYVGLYITYSNKKCANKKQHKITKFKSLKSNSTAQVTFDPPKTILTLKGKEVCINSKGRTFDKEKGVLMCLAKANGFDYDKVSELVANAKKQTPKLTNVERFILENLPKEYKWIARSECFDLCIYKFEPCKSEISYTLNAFNHLFQFIKWSDDEPYEISKLLEEK